MHEHIELEPEMLRCLCDESAFEFAECWKQFKGAEKEE